YRAPVISHHHFPVLSRLNLATHSSQFCSPKILHRPSRQNFHCQCALQPHQRQLVEPQESSSSSSSKNSNTVIRWLRNANPSSSQVAFTRPLVSCPPARRRAMC